MRLAYVAGQPCYVAKALAAHGRAEGDDNLKLLSKEQQYYGPSTQIRRGVKVQCLWWSDGRPVPRSYRVRPLSGCGLHVSNSSNGSHWRQVAAQCGTEAQGAADEFAAVFPGLSLGSKRHLHGCSC